MRARQGPPTPCRGLPRPSQAPSGLGNTCKRVELPSLLGKLSGKRKNLIRTQERIQWLEVVGRRGGSSTAAPILHISSELFQPWMYVLYCLRSTHLATAPDAMVLADTRSAVLLAPAPFPLELAMLDLACAPDALVLAEARSPAICT